MKNRDLEPATTTLKVVEEKGFEKDLPVEVSQAKKMTSELEYLEQVCWFVLTPVAYLAYVTLRIETYNYKVERPCSNVNDLLGVQSKLGFPV